MRSAAHVCIPGIPEDLFLKAINLAIARNAPYVPPSTTDALLYIRPVIFGSGPQLQLQPSFSYTFCVFVLPAAAYHGADALDALVMEDFDRAAPKGTGCAKVGGNYAPVIRWSNKAKEEGYGITLHLDSKTQTTIEEFSTSGFLGIKEDKDGVTLVVPDSGNVIESITSDSCMQMAKHLGWKVEKRAVRGAFRSHYTDHSPTNTEIRTQIPFSSLGSFTEVLAVGTAAALVGIKSITRRSTNETFSYSYTESAMGKNSEKLRNAVKEVQTGRAKDSFGWLQRVVNA